MAGDVEFSVGATDTGFQAAMEKARVQAAETAESIQSSFEGIKGTFASLQSAFLAFTAVLAGGELFRDAIASTVEMNVESLALGKQFGISTTAASQLRVALAGVFVTQEQYQAAAQKLTISLNKNEEAFHNVGIATRDSSGQLRPLADLMAEVNTYLGTLTEGTNRNAAAVTFYGRAWREVEPAMRVTQAALEEGRKSADELGLTIGTEDVAATQRYRAAMNGAHEVTEGLGKVITTALMPVLSSMGEWFRSTGPEDISNFRNVLRNLEEGFIIIGGTINKVLDSLDAGLDISVAYAQRFGAVVKSVLSGDTLEEVQNVWNRGTANLQAVTTTALTKIQADAYLTQQSLDKVMESLSGKTTPTATPPPGGAAPEKDMFDKRLDAWIKELDLEYAALKKQHEAEMEVYKQQEAEFSKAAGVRIAIAEEEVDAEARAYGKGSPQYEAAVKHLVDVRRQADEELRQMADAFSKQDQDRQLQALALEEKTLQDRYAKHEINIDQLESAEIALESRRTAILEGGIRDRLALIDPQHDPVAYANLNAQIEQQELEHQARLTKIQQDANARNLQLWAGLFTSIQSDFSQNIAKMLEGTETFASGMRSLFASLVNSIIQFLSQWAVKWAATQIANLAASKAAATGQATAQAGAAGAGGVASMAAAPWPIDLTAPAFGASMFAAAESYAVADRGYDIPSGVNPLTQLHAREMVLPEELADSVRSGAGGGDIHVHTHLSAFDSSGLERLAQSHQFHDQIAAAAKRYMNRGGR